MRRQLISNHARRTHRLDETVPTILQALHNKRNEKEARILQKIHGPYNEEKKVTIISLKSPPPPRIPETKESYISKVMKNVVTTKEKRKQELLNNLRNEICPDWSDPTIRDITRSQRSFMDFFEMAIIDELSHIESGWSIYMDFMCGRTHSIPIIKICIDRAICKRPWLKEKRELLEKERLRNIYYSAAVEASKKGVELEETRQQRRLNAYIDDIITHPYFTDLASRQDIYGGWAHYFHGLNKNFNDDYDTDIDDFTDCMSYD
jgi:hypothetical protein